MKSVVYTKYGLPSVLQITDVENPKPESDEVNKKVIDEMNAMAEEQSDFSMPNDMKKMAYGGFEVAVEG